MAESRYAVGAEGLGTSQVGSQTTSGSTSSSGTTSQQGGSSTKQTMQQSNMDPKSLEALQQLIAQLLGGGTAETARGEAERAREIQAVRGQRAGFTREAALADAEGAMSQQMRQVMEQLVPSLTRAAEGAGTSQNSMRALLLQDAAARAAESSSALGLNAVSQYGQIGSSLSSVLEALTRPENAATQALINALGIAKGAQVSGTTQTDQNTWGTSQQQSNQQTNQQQNSSIYKTPTYATSTTPVGAPSGSLVGSGLEGSGAGIFSSAGVSNSGGSGNFDAAYDRLFGPDPWAAYTF